MQENTLFTFEKLQELTAEALKNPSVQAILDDLYEEDDDIELFKSPKCPNFLLNKEKHENMIQISKQLESLLNEAYIDYEMSIDHGNELGMGSIRIVATVYSISQAKEIGFILTQVDTLDIYPMLDGNIEIILGFRNIGIPITGKARTVFTKRINTEE